MPHFVSHPGHWTASNFAQQCRDASLPGSKSTLDLKFLSKMYPNLYEQTGKFFSFAPPDYIAHPVGRSGVHAEVPNLASTLIESSTVMVDATAMLVDQCRSVELSELALGLRTASSASQVSMSELGAHTPAGRMGVREMSSDEEILTPVIQSRLVSSQRLTPRTPVVTSQDSSRRRQKLSKLTPSQQSQPRSGF